MARIMEIFVILNAACGIAAFLLARGVIRWINRHRRGIEPSKNLDDPERKELP